jgi:tetratricopeptide (TPR) repeat protein
MATCIHGFYGGLDTRAAWARSREAVARAQALAPGTFDVHLADGIQEYYYGWDLARSERELKLALAANPKDPEPYYWLGLLRGSQGDPAGARPFLQTAAGLDPFSTYPLIGTSWAYVNAGAYDQCLQVAQRILEMDPASLLGLWHHGLAHIGLGSPDRAMESLHRLVELTHRGSFGLGILAAGHAAAGRRGEAEALLQEVAEASARAFVPATHTLHATVLLGNAEGALDLARRAVEDRNAYAWWYLQFNPATAELREDPSFRTVLEGLRPA